MSSPRPGPRRAAHGLWDSLLVAAVSLALIALGPLAARASSVEDIRQLETLINAGGTRTLVSSSCPPNHAGYYENDGKRINRLVICRRNVDLSDLDSVWEVLAHEATHIMQTCVGGAVLADAQMPRTYRELQTMAPHYAKLINAAYGSGDQRLEAEAFWMELQAPQRVLEMFRSSCASRLGTAPPSRGPQALVVTPDLR
jgi:hypothetical protein